MIENKNELVLFSGCSHHGIVNITKTITEKFPNKTINTIIGGFHLIGLPIVNTLGKPREEVISIGNTLNEKKIDRMYSCHCNGAKGFNILKTVLKKITIF